MIETSHKNKPIKIIDYINKNAAAIGIISATFIATVANLLRVFLYVYYCGWFKYFEINRINISITNKNFYDIALSASVCVIYFTLNYFVFEYIKNKQIKKLLKLIMSIGTLNTIFILIVTDSPLLAFRFIDAIIVAISAFIIFPFIECLFGLIHGIDELISNKKNRKSKQDNKDDISDYNNHGNFFNLIKRIIVTTLLLVSIYLLMYFGFGYWDASHMKTFKMTEKDSVVLFETETHYIVARCTINSDTIEINKNLQKYIDKTDVATKILSLNTLNNFLFTDRFD